MSEPEQSAPLVTARTPSGGAEGFLAAHRKAWEFLGNSLLCLSAVVFNYIMLTDFLMRHRISSLYVALFEGGVIVFAVTRPMPKEANGSLYDWLIALLGTYAIMLIRPAADVNDHVALLVLQILGMAISLTGLLSLNHSFGLVAANRGVKSRGLYRIVRHPIYAGYFLSFGAFLLQNITLFNFLIYGVFVALELLRIKAEERVLSRDLGYAHYARRTRWRVLPLIY
ncbi:MAG: isoprenylcysteine carboxylmethyltransferase family protein [Steroidobacteraceae bacterium]